MKLNYTKTKSTVKPDILDTTSSKVVVYLRKNIEKIDEVDQTSGDTIQMYVYDEATLTKEEYDQYVAELNIRDIQQQRADIDYIALMTDVDLEENVL